MSNLQSLHKRKKERFRSVGLVRHIGLTITTDRFCMYMNYTDAIIHIDSIESIACSTSHGYPLM